MKHDTCVCCGVYVPEGRQACGECELGSGRGVKLQDKNEKEKFLEGFICEIDKQIEYCHDTGVPILTVVGLQMARMIVERKLKV